MKKLFLASEAKNEETIKRLETFVGGLKGKSIAYIPTAANGEEMYGKWKTGTTWNVFNGTGAEVEPVVLEEYKNASVIKKLENKDIIFFHGGMCGYLMYWLIRCEIDKALPKLLEKSIYVGSSAGSMICAKTLLTSEIYINQPEPGATNIPGLGLVEFDFYPHYEDDLLPKIKEVWSGGDLYLVKNGEVITVVGDKIEVLGEKRILRNGEIV